MASVAALAWYRLMWIPGQERYLHERNLRILHTTARQITVKIDNFDLTIDHAMQSVDQTDAKKVLPTLSRYAPLLAPELEIQDSCRSTIPTGRWWSFRSRPSWRR